MKQYKIIIKRNQVTVINQDSTSGLQEIIIKYGLNNTYDFFIKINIENDELQNLLSSIAPHFIHYPPSNHIVKSTAVSSETIQSLIDSTRNAYNLPTRVVNALLNIPLQTECDTLLKNPLPEFIFSTPQNNSFFNSSFVDFSQTLLHTQRGRYEKLIEVIRTNIGSILTKNSAVDCSERVFLNVSPFQYMLWALDKFAWDRVTQGVLQYKNSEEIRLQLLNQLNELEANGIVYAINKQIVIEQHYDFSLLKELQLMVQSQNQDTNCNETNNFLQEDKFLALGIEQCQIPMHIAYIYCGVDPLYPCPTFEDEPTQFSQQFNNHGKRMNWYNPISAGGAKGLGKNYAIIRGKNPEAIASEGIEFTENTEYDLQAFTALRDKRMMQYFQLKQQLQTPVAQWNFSAEVTRKDANTI